VKRIVQLARTAAGTLGVAVGNPALYAGLVALAALASTGYAMARW
jgi:hypothetical protein